MIRALMVSLMFLIMAAVLPAQRVSPHARNAVEVIRQLRKIPVQDPARQRIPPERVQPLLRQLNSHLGELIGEVLRAPHVRRPSGQNPETLWEKILAELEAAGWEEVPPHKWNSYGEIADISEQYLGDYDPPLLAVITDLWLPCGPVDPDSRLYVFERAVEGWTPILITEVDYDPIRGHRDNGFQYAISPQDQQGNWFLVAGHAPPTCGSRSPYIRYKALRPGKTPFAPRTLIEGRSPVNSVFDSPFQIRVEEDWFAITRGANRNLDGGLAIFIARYGIDGDRATRIGPLAVTPDDFLDEWISLPWKDAVQWTDKSDVARLMAWHARLNVLVPEAAELVLVQPCPPSLPGLAAWIIGIEFDSGTLANTPETLFFRISRRRGNFFLDDINPDRPSGCPGNQRFIPKVTSQFPDWRPPN